MAKELYHECNNLGLKGELKDQLHRATLSICLNLAEGSGKTSRKEQKRFYEIAFASIRETQAILDQHQNEKLTETCDKLTAATWKLHRTLNT